MAPIEHQIILTVSRSSMGSPWLLRVFLTSYGELLDPDPWAHIILSLGAKAWWIISWSRRDPGLAVVAGIMRYSEFSIDIPRLVSGSIGGWWHGWELRAATYQAASYDSNIIHSEQQQPRSPQYILIWSSFDHCRWAIVIILFHFGPPAVPSGLGAFVLVLC